MIESMKTEEFRQIFQEITNLSCLFGHINIMSFENTFIHKVPLANGKNLLQIFIEMDYAENTLSKMIADSPNKQISQGLLIDIIKQISSGLLFAHEKKCTHLDIKPGNILFVGNTAKIADWGGSLILKTNHSTKLESKALVYSAGFVAPEIIDDENAPETINLYKSDVYSLGILCLNCCGISLSKIKKIPKNENYHDIEINKFIKEDLSISYSNKFCDLMKNMCKYNAKSRPTIEEVEKKLKDLFE